MTIQNTIKYVTVFILTAFTMSVAFADKPNKKDTAQYILSKLPEVLFEEASLQKKYGFEDDYCTFTTTGADDYGRGLKWKILSPMKEMTSYVVNHEGNNTGAHIMIECKNGRECSTMKVENGKIYYSKKEEFHKNSGDISILQKTSKAFSHLMKLCSGEKELF